MTASAWTPPDRVTRDDTIRMSDRALSRPKADVSEREDVFRITAAGYEWDVAGRVYDPEGGAAEGPDGRRIGVLLLHGGAGDHRVMAPMAEILAQRFSYRVATLTFPGQLNLDSPDRRWPGETIHDDGTVRVPVFQTGRPITPDQYVVRQDAANPRLRARHGTLFFANALAGTEFHDRLASWPLAYETALMEVCRRNFDPAAYSVYLHGHSTGGPLVHMLLQRVANIAGLVGCESSPYGAIFSQMLEYRWLFPFNYMTVRTWRDTARYRGREEGARAIERFPWLIEEVFEEWKANVHFPNIKFQDTVQFNAHATLRDAALVTARRLGLSDDDREALVDRYLGYPHPLPAAAARPVPPLLYSINLHSMDHTEPRYREVLLPALAKLDVPPRVGLTVFETGVHSYWRPEPGLPVGVAAAAAELWNQAIQNEFYVVGRAG